jgi:putative transposase
LTFIAQSKDSLWSLDCTRRRRIDQRADFGVTDAARILCRASPCSGGTRLWSLQYRRQWQTLVNLTSAATRFAVEQIVAVLKQAEMGMPVADVIRHIGISEQTFYRWKKQYAGLQSDQVREFKQLQEENARLKKLVADLSLDKAILQDINQKKWSGPR